MLYYRDEVIHCGEYGDREKEKAKDVCVNTRHPKPKEILLECGCQPQAAIFEVYDYCVKCDQVFVLDRVNVEYYMFYSGRLSKLNFRASFSSK
jgi:hypothetical protein